MRGEEAGRVDGLGYPSELPPHARRRARGQRFTALHFGITSACAEKSLQIAFGS